MSGDVLPPDGTDGESSCSSDPSAWTIQIMRLSKFRPTLEPSGLAPKCSKTIQPGRSAYAADVFSVGEGRGVGCGAGVAVGGAATVAAGAVGAVGAPAAAVAVAEGAGAAPEHATSVA